MFIKGQGLLDSGSVYKISGATQRLHYPLIKEYTLNILGTTPTII